MDNHSRHTAKMELWVITLFCENLNTHAHTQTCTNIKINTTHFRHTYTHIHIHIHTYTYTHTHAHTHTQTHTPIHTHADMHTHTYTHTYRQRSVNRPGWHLNIFLWCIIGPNIVRGHTLVFWRQVEFDKPCHGQILHIVQMKTLILKRLQNPKNGQENLAKSSSDALAILKQQIAS